MGNCIKSKVKRQNSSSHALQTSFVDENSIHITISEKTLILAESPRNSELRKSLQKHSIYDAPSARISMREKTLEESKLIRSCLLSHSIFNGLKNSDIQEIIQKMKHFSLDPNKLVCEQGQPGSYFFVITSGKVQVLVNNEPKAILHRGQSFGELALMHDSVRMASIMTNTKVSLWGVDRNTFKQALKNLNERCRAENRVFLESIPLFKGIDSHEKDLLLDTIVIQEFQNAERIIIEGDPGHNIYFIKDGEVRVSRNGEFIRDMGKGELFGEQALLYNTLRTATVTSIGTTQILSMDRVAILEALGDKVLCVLYRNSLRIAIEDDEFVSFLDKHQIDSLLERVLVKEFKPGELVAEAGTSKSQKLMIVANGAVKLGRKVFYKFKCLGSKEMYYNDSASVYKKDIVATEDTFVGEIYEDDLQRKLGGSLSSVYNLNEAVKLLKKVYIFTSLSSDTINRLANALRIQEFKSGDLVFMQNDPGTAFYIVKEGTVSIEIDGVLRREIGKSGFFGERSIILNENRSASAIAGSNTQLWVLTRSHFLSIVEEGIRKQILKRSELRNTKVQLEDLKFVKEIGRGRTGVTFMTVSLHSQDTYAVKAVSRHTLNHLNAWEILNNERNLLKIVDHPFILNVYMTFKDENYIFFLMEFVNGCTLREVLLKHSIFSCEEALFYANCLMITSEHLRKHSIVHRNINLDTVWIDSEGYVKLGHFKYGKILEGRTNSVIGDPFYMAPEVVLGREYSFEADLWSIGIIVYELVCGTHPFGNDERLEQSRNDISGNLRNSDMSPQMQNPLDIYRKIIDKDVIFPSFIKENNKLFGLLDSLLKKNTLLRNNAARYFKVQMGNYWDKFVGKSIEPPFIPSAKNYRQAIGVITEGQQSLVSHIYSQEKEERNQLEEIHEIPYEEDHNFISF